MNLVRSYAGWLGVLCLLGAGALALFVPWLTRLEYALLIAAGALFLLALIANGGKLLGVAGHRAARYGAGAAL